jgi:hypothetical protein
MAPPWSVHRYSIDELRSLLTRASMAAWPADCVHDKYFEDYFEAIGARSVLVEHDYIDHDFLDDFAAYYVRCFKDYPRKCSRLHFFKTLISVADVENALGRNDATAVNKLRRGYLGFVVVRPVPQRCIGRTCLVTYPRADGRHYTNLRDYDAHPFGLQFEVNSLAFQQQDQIVAECATAALWSAFQATGKLFGHRIPSPAEITHAATRRIPLETRTLPASGGLSVEQMADAIRACDLEPLHVGATDARHLRAAVHGYAGAGIPVIVIGDVVPTAAPNDRKKILGRHAVTITGYHVPPAAGAAATGRLRSDRIDKVYAHDDAVGPFARMAFIPKANHASVLTTSLAPNRAAIGTRLFKPLVVLVPLYHKIRIPFERVWNEIATLDHFIQGIGNSGVADALPTLEWDLHLTTVSEYKGELLKRRAVRGRRRVLESAMPRFIWLARGVHPDGSGVDLLFDATGIGGDDLCFLRVDGGSVVPATLRAAGFVPEQFRGAEAAATVLLAEEGPEDAGDARD